MRERLKNLWRQWEPVLRAIKGGVVFEFNVLLKTYLTVPARRAWVRVVLPIRYARLWMAAKLSKKRAAGEPTKPAPGWVWNPLLSYPRNLACYCGSGVKFKKCHEPREVRVVTQEKADFLKGYLRAAGLA